MAGNSKEKVPDAPKDAGRPSKFTPERCDAIVHDIGNRIPYEYAAEANGITEKTLYNWLDIAKTHQEQEIDSDYTRFLQDIKKAERGRIREHLDMIAAQPERWQAHAWLLERRWHKYFGPNAQLNELNQRLAKLEYGDSKDEKGNEEASKED